MFLQFLWRAYMRTRTYIVQAQTHTHLFIYGQTNKMCACVYMWTIEFILINKNWSYCNIWYKHIASNRVYALQAYVCAVFRIFWHNLSKNFFLFFLNIFGPIHSVCTLRQWSINMVKFYQSIAITYTCNTEPGGCANT